MREEINGPVETKKRDKIELVSMNKAKKVTVRNKVRESIEKR